MFASLCGLCESLSLSHICFCCSVISLSLSLSLSLLFRALIISLHSAAPLIHIPPSYFCSLCLSSRLPFPQRLLPSSLSPLSLSFCLLSSQIYSIENAHGQLVRDLDFNPNRQYYLASCGDDCKVKFWDVRNVQEPVKTLEEHSHWVWSVRYNHSHDQLVLTASSDSRLILSNMVSISSEPFGHLVDDEELSEGEDNRQDDKSKEPLKDSVVSTYEEHEDSVYAAEWSSADPWLFASLSYDGRLVINRVPRALKYRILL
uniref:EARP complex and GARP complex interacting protein 1 n=1 Tax=Labrus bergylta TaxID=56723 RepID=A0A3Q3ECJ6_9LABR|nr:EARP-interacting protein homolog [Labrus bergylta]